MAWKGVPKIPMHGGIPMQGCPTSRVKGYLHGVVSPHERWNEAVIGPGERMAAKQKIGSIQGD